MGEEASKPVVDEESKPDTRELFKKEKKRFGAAVKIAIAVSKAAGGRTPDENIVMASFVFTRMCIAADTLLYVLRRDIGNSKEQTLDHYSIGVLARNIIESALMFHYLSEEGVSKEEWQVRIAILNLHDATLKVRLWKGLDEDEHYRGWKATMEEIRESLKGHPIFKAADPDQQKRMLSGQQLYVGGFRSTLKLADLDEEYFDGMYAYLSAQVHVGPTSFYWTHKRLNFGKPASYQYYFASYALAHVRRLFLQSAIRLAESDDVVRKKIEPAMFDELKGLAAIHFGE
jgi:hypothetical protein